MAISLTPPLITHLAHTSKGKMRPGPQINAIERRSYDAAALTAAASAALVQSKPLVRDDRWRGAAVKLQPAGWRLAAARSLYIRLAAAFSLLHSGGPRSSGVRPGTPEQSHTQNEIVDIPTRNTGARPSPGSG